MGSDRRTSMTAPRNAPLFPLEKGVRRSARAAGLLPKWFSHGNARRWIDSTGTRRSERLSSDAGEDRLGLLLGLAEGAPCVLVNPSRVDYCPRRPFRHLLASLRFLFSMHVRRGAAGASACSFPVPHEGR